MQPTTIIEQKNGTMSTDFNLKQFILTTLIVSIWINLSEVFRYFAFVKPMMQDYLPMVPGVVPINWPVFAIWGIWDTILTALVVFVYWLVAQRFGNNQSSAALAGTTSWMLLFVLFWVAAMNMALAPVKIAFIALPLAWVEMAVACWISSKLYAANWSRH
jgi:hypothetical protein